MKIRFFEKETGRTAPINQKYFICGNGYVHVYDWDPNEQENTIQEIDSIAWELDNKFKNLLLDEVIKELNALSGGIDLGLSTDVFVQIALKAAIEKVEAMKCN